MTNALYIQDSVENKISYYHVAAFLVSLPFDRFYSQLVLVSFIAHTLIHINRDLFRSIISRENIILSSVLLVNIAGMLYSPDMGQAWKDIQRQSAIILFPFIFSVSRFPFFKYKAKLLTIFGITCVATVLYLYLDAFLFIYHNHLVPTFIFAPAFINHQFSAPIDMHATYFSMYIVVAMVFFVTLLLDERRPVYRQILAAAILILFAGLLQLASKAVLIALVVIIFGLPFFTRMGIHRTRFISFSFLFGIIAIASIASVDSLKYRFVGGLQRDLVEDLAEKEMLEPRIARWKAAWGLVQQKPIIGYGSGTEKRILKEEYFKKEMYSSYIQELNAHNQYLSSWLKTGIWGLCILLLTLVYGFFLAWKQRDGVFYSFIVLLAIVAFSENILDVNKGIFFYAFFFCFFAKQGKPFSG